MANDTPGIYIKKLSDNGSVFKFIYNFLILSVKLVLAVPHLIIFAFHPKKKLILSDVYDVKNLLLSLIFVKHYRNLFYYRVGNCKYFFKWLLPEDSTIHVPVSLDLGSHAHFVHNTSCFLNAKKIGDNFVCYHHVTIGTNGLGYFDKPVIGNNVTIYTGAVVVGNITIGDNVIISANSVVIKNVPSNSLIVGNPAMIVKLNGQRVDIKL
ncbi:serine acetyltransferase [Mucilaginibacter sp.]